MRPYFFRQLALIGCVAAPLLPSRGNLFAQGAPLPQPAPSLHERNKYLKAEFELLDGNKDRQISEAEFRHNSQKAIEEAERLAKKHGYEAHLISQLYTMNRRARKKFPEVSHIDTNGDGLISLHKEFLKFPSLMFSDFSRWDLNGDGRITRHEFLKSKQQEQKEHEAASANAPVAEAPQQLLEREFALRDRNNDGDVIWKELLALNDLLPPVAYEGTDAAASFLATDTDYDGVISRDEFLAPARRSGDEEFLLLEQKVFRIRDLNGDRALSFLEFVQTGENLARGFVAYDEDGDGVIVFEDVRGIQWVDGGKNIDRDRYYFARLDANQDRRVAWKEYRTASPRQTAFGAIDHLQIDNAISREEWEAVEQEYLAGQTGEPIPPHARSYYATAWFPGIFDLITFDDVDSNKDGLISWKEFEAFPN